MKDNKRKKLFLKKKTISFLSDNQMDKVIGATGDECFSATCPGDRGCDDTDADCVGPTDGGACPTDVDCTVDCATDGDPGCGTDNESGCGTIGPGHTGFCLSDGLGWCTSGFGCTG